MAPCLEPTAQLCKPKTKHGGRLLDLPSEIRILIYEQMFPHDTVEMYAILGSLHKAEDAHHVAGDHVAILATCRGIYDEAKPVLYNNTEFRIHTRDQYWLLLWNTDAFEEKFSTSASDTPDVNEWIEGNPWLQNPRSIVPVGNIRKLSFDIECGTSSLGRQWTWTAQLKHTLRGATSVAKLHIALEASLDDNILGLDQHETDLVLETLEQTVKCHGIVTAEMASSLGPEEFIPASYYKMLAAYKGVDKTHERFSREMSHLWSKHTIQLQELEKQTRLMRSKSEYRIRFADEQYGKMEDDEFATTLSRLDHENSTILSRIKTAQGLLAETMGEISSLQLDWDMLGAAATKAGCKILRLS